MRLANRLPRREVFGGVGRRPVLLQAIQLLDELEGNGSARPGIQKFAASVGPAGDVLRGAGEEVVVLG